jgi:FkbM family methyltransferase
VPAERAASARLVFDLGFHRGEDVAFYLHRGFDVVAVDADPRLVAEARRAFAGDVASGRLELVQAAVVGRAAGDLEFHLSKNTVWNSVDSRVSAREGMYDAPVVVPTIDLPALIDRYGVPYYCKVDLEGADIAAVESLSRVDELPRYVSAETECLAEGEVADAATATATLDRLRSAGYERFKLVDQRSLTVLEPGRSFYPVVEPFHPPVEPRRLSVLDPLLNPYRRNERRLARRFGHRFPHGASGPFGPDLSGEWLGYDTARETLLFHRSEYYAMSKAVSYGFWCDWHATPES